MDSMELGSSPCEENCAQVGTDNYHDQAQKECRAYINQLKRQFGEPPAGAGFKIKSFPHDFGTYKEVVVYWEANNEEACEYAFKVEGDLPANWDEKATLELMPRFLNT